MLVDGKGVYIQEVFRFEPAPGVKKNSKINKYLFNIQYSLVIYLRGGSKGIGSPQSQKQKKNVIIKENQINNLGTISKKQKKVIKYQRPGQRLFWKGIPNQTNIYNKSYKLSSDHCHDPCERNVYSL